MGRKKWWKKNVNKEDRRKMEEGVNENKSEGERVKKCRKKRKCENEGKYKGREKCRKRGKYRKSKDR